MRTNWFPNPVYGDMDYEMRYTEYTSKGWESHVYRRTDQGWRIEHLHHSSQPPRS